MCPGMYVKKGATTCMSEYVSEMFPGENVSTAVMDCDNTMAAQLKIYSENNNK